MITVYTIAYNEETVLPFMIKWYKSKFPNCKIIVYDNYSTDNTEKIALENNCEVIKYDSNNEIRDDLYLDIKNNCWKNAETEWVLICDTDEFLDINEDQLKKETSTIITSKGYNMYNIEEGTSISKSIYGARAVQYDKSYLFNKNEIKEINYLPGCHSSNPIGNIIKSEITYNCYHYLYIGEEYVINKYQRNFKRLSKQNKDNNWGFHYKRNSDKIKDEFEVARKFFNIKHPENDDEYIIRCNFLHDELQQK